MDAAIKRDNAENSDLRNEPSEAVNGIDNMGGEESGSLPCVSNIVTFDVIEEPFV